MYNNIALLLGHLVGDYLVQSKDMALNKSKPGSEGRNWCIYHCLWYSTMVASFVTIAGWRVIKFEDFFSSYAVAFIIAFITHYPLDRTSFGWWWMKMIKQSQFSDDPTDKRNYFVGPVYIAIDNTWHLLLMWVAFSLLGLNPEPYI
jgi:hypothetical protein